MHFYYFFIVLIALSAILSYINTRYLKLPFTIGLMALAMVFSLAIVFLQQVFPNVYAYTEGMMEGIDFSSLILEVMLAFLLFAGALHTDSSLLRQERRSIVMLSLVGVLLSTLLIGGMLYGIGLLLHIQIPLVYCLLFGSLISPTDPIAVLGILTKANAPKKIEINIVGESLFNDGVGVVIFISILQLIRSGTESFDAGKTLLLFVQEAGGGLLAGWLLGQLMILMLRTIDHFETEVLITLAGVMGGYMLCQKLHISGALAIVLAGLMLGGRGKAVAMSTTTEAYLFKFWELVDVLMNSVLFVLMGMRIMILDIQNHFWLAAILVIPAVLLARLLSVRLALLISGANKQFDKNARKMLIWGGLRGGLSIALALSLSQSAEKDLLVFLTYAVVLFSILVQGLSIGPMTQKLFPSSKNKDLNKGHH